MTSLHAVMKKGHGERRALLYSCAGSRRRLIADPIQDGRLPERGFLRQADDSSV